MTLQHLAHLLGKTVMVCKRVWPRSLHSSPLEPLKNRLTILKLVGWPLKIVNKEGTEVRRRKLWVFVIIWTIWMFGFAVTASSLVHFSGFSYNDTIVILRKEHIKSWDEKSLWILSVPNYVRPWGILYFYRDIDSKMTAFLRDFVLLGVQLPKGNGIILYYHNL